MYDTVEKIPFDIRAMIRLLINNIDDTINKETKLIEEKVAYLLADLLAGCWLNGGFRW